MCRTKNRCFKTINRSLIQTDLSIAECTLKSYFQLLCASLQIYCLTDTFVKEMRVNFFDRNAMIQDHPLLLFKICLRIFPLISVIIYVNICWRKKNGLVHLYKSSYFVAKAKDLLTVKVRRNIISQVDYY